MSGSEKSAEEVILESYLHELDTLRSKMNFCFFANNKPCSFNYELRSEFETLINKIKADHTKKKLVISPAISNRIPVFLPKETRRIAFFAYKSKSVREVKIDELESILTKMADKKFRAESLCVETVKKMVEEDLNEFKKYQAEHSFDGYRRDVNTATVQFNAYDKDDNLLVEKSFIKGGIVFEMEQKDFAETIKISYPQYRKQRSDKKSDYLPLKLINIRGIRLKKEEAS